MAEENLEEILGQFGGNHEGNLEENEVNSEAENFDQNQEENLLGDEEENLLDDEGENFEENEKNVLNPVKKKPKRWLIVRDKPIYIEYHPCIHRWKREHPEETFQDIYQTSERIDVLAVPMWRRLLELWLAHSHHMSPEMRARVLKLLLGFGFTEDMLNALLEAQRLERERLARFANAGPFDVLDENGYPIPTNYDLLLKARKDKKTKKRRRKRKPKTKGWQPGKRGQLKAGWPHKTGLRLLMSLLNIPLPDEEFIANARAYFDVQASALFKIVHKVLDQSNGNLELPSSLDEMIAVGCLSFCLWIAKNVVGPAALIADEDVEECLAWKGEIPPKKKPKKAKSKKKKKKGKKKGKGKKNKKGKKGRKAKKKNKSKPKPEKPPEPQQNNEVEAESEEEEESSSPDPFESLKAMFRETSLWYNPQTPEFLLQEAPAPKKLVEFVLFFENLMWKFPSLDDFDLQPLNPNPVPRFFSRLRPQCCPEKDDTPWYIMTDSNGYADAKSDWDTAYTYETFEMVADLIKSMISTPKFSVSRMLELVAEICDAIEVNDSEALTSPELDALDAKRTIIFERIFIKVFSKKCRDYDLKTCGYMETICRRAAVLVRYLYQHTSRELWNYQRSSAPRPPTPEPVPVEEPFDEDMFNNWSLWLEFLLRATRDAKRWQKWLLDITALEKLPRDRNQLIEEAEKWLELGESTQAEAEEFKDKAEFLEPIKVPIDIWESRFEETGAESVEFNSDFSEPVPPLIHYFQEGFEDDTESSEDG